MEGPHIGLNDHQIDFNTSEPMIRAALPHLSRCPVTHKPCQIYLFKGSPTFRGISPESYLAIEKTIQKQFIHATIHACPREQVTPEKWNKKSILVLPGGTVSQWELDERSLSKWFKSRKGRIFAVCAGSYQCSYYSEYRVDENRTIEKTRKLALFPGVCTGPAFSHELRVVKVRWLPDQQEGYVAVIGGGVFIPKSIKKKMEYRPLAVFVDKPQEQSLTVVQCARGNGIGVLTTAHWEFNSEDIEAIKLGFPDRRNEFEEMQRKLDLSADFRRTCMAKMLRLLEDSSD